MTRASLSPIGGRGPQFYRNQVPGALALGMRTSACASSIISRSVTGRAAPVGARQHAVQQHVHAGEPQRPGAVSRLGARGG